MNKDSVEKVIEATHVKWLSKAETAVIRDSELTVLPYGYLSQAVREAITSLIEADIKEMEGAKKSQEQCECGGKLVKAYGTGLVSFPLQCEKCGSYTDYTHNGYNTALDHQISRKREELKALSK